MTPEPGADAGRLVVLGRGRVGRSLAAAAREAGLRVALEPARERLPGLVSRLAAAPGALVVLAVPDGAIAANAAELATEPGLDRTAAFAHVSGAMGLDALAPLAARGHPVGSFHPLQPFPVEREPAAFRGGLVAVDGSDGAMVARLEGLARRLGAVSHRVRDGDRAAHHAAAVLAANALVALADQSRLVFEAAGWPADLALAAVVSLMRGALGTVESLGLPEALTGPVARGDVETVSRHLEALGAVAAPGARAHPREVYRLLGLAATDLAQRRGLATGPAGRVERALTADFSGGA
jgi:predicted short-subunit dehydrogenase-like oxidoreductase (DUF2520 family)